MSLEDKELMQFKVGKKEQYAARMAFFYTRFCHFHMGAYDTYD
ncbi:hypothetical protein [Megamonas funiformis]